MWVSYINEEDTGGEYAVLIGDFFDTLDRDFLWENESVSSADFRINSASALLPSISFTNLNSSPSESFVLPDSDSDSDWDNLIMTSTPVDPTLNPRTPVVPP